MKLQYDQSDSLSHVNCKTSVARGSLLYAQSEVEDRCES
jgi:hypothetical protein